MAPSCSLVSAKALHTPSRWLPTFLPPNLQRHHFPPKDFDKSGECGGRRCWGGGNRLIVVRRVGGRFLEVCYVERVQRSYSIATLLLTNTLCLSFFLIHPYYPLLLCNVFHVSVTTWVLMVFLLSIFFLLFVLYFLLFCVCPSIMKPFFPPSLPLSPCQVSSP